MPSRFYQLFQSSALGVLQAQLAEAAGDVMWWPLGNQGSAQSVEAIWNEEMAQDDASRGHENLRKGTLVILDDSLAIDARDLFQIKGQQWIVRSIVRPTEPVIEVDLERREYEVRNGEAGKKLI